MPSFKDFATQGKYIKLVDVGDSVNVKVKVDPFTLEPREGSFKDPVTKEPRLVVDYVFEDPKTGEEKIFTNGSQAFAQQMAKMKVGDLVRIVKIERNGKATYTVKAVSKSKVEEVEEAEEGVNEEEDNGVNVKDIPF